jgi:hypothetical protein
MFKPRILAAALIAVAMALTFGAGTASADISLTSPNNAISPYAGPYGSVNVSVDATGKIATFTFTANPSAVNGNDYLFGDGSTAAVNVTGGAFGAGGNLVAAFVSESNSYNPTGGFTPTFDKFDSGNVDGFGTFNLTLNNKDGFGDTATTVIFTVTRTTGTWATDGSDVLTANSNGATVAAHVYVTEDPANASNTALATGYAANGGAISVPEPSTVAIAGLGALGFIGYGLRRRRVKK